VGCVLAGGVPLWAVSPLVVFPLAVFGGCPPPVPLSRVAASFHVSVFTVLRRPGAWPTSRVVFFMLSRNFNKTLHSVYA